MNQHHQISGIEISNGFLSLVVDGKKIKRELVQISLVLAKATSAQQAEFEISPSGYGIHWPLVDEDISIDGLLGIYHQRESNREIA